MVKLAGPEKGKEQGDKPNILAINDLVNVRLSGVEHRQFEWDGETRHKLRWEFVVTDPGPWQGKVIWGETSIKYVAHPNCKPYNWAAALLGTQPDVSQGLDTDDLLGLPARIMIGHKVDKQGRTWMRAKEVLAPKAAVSQPQPEEPPF